MEENPAYLENLLGGLDSTIHEPVRLGILTLLHLNSSLTFSVLQKGLGVTSGNLNSHLTKLVSVGFVEQEKTFVNVRPRTVVHITSEGRKALKKYTKSLKIVLVGIERGTTKKSPVDQKAPE
ncbi:MAG: transcriptional regulator [Promethearchaeota archaeon]